MKFDAEAELALHLTAEGIAFEQQYKYCPGRNFKADFAIVDRRILIEVNGGIWNNEGAHGRVSGIIKDIERLNLATLHGYFMLRFTPDDVARGKALQFILQVLGARKNGATSE